MTARGMSLQISALAELPAGLAALRAEARREGHRFLERLASEWAAGVTRFDRPGEALLAAHQAGVLARIGGLTLDPAVPGALRMAAVLRPPGVPSSQDRAEVGRGAAGTAGHGGAEREGQRRHGRGARVLGSTRLRCRAVLWAYPCPQAAIGLCHARLGA